MRNPTKTPARRLLGSWPFMTILNIGLPALADAQVPVAGAHVGALWTVDSIRSSVLGEARRIRVALPFSYHEASYATARYPVLIVLDAQADLHFASYVANARLLAHFAAPAIPEMIVVGVETSPNRYHDMTPPPLDGPERTEPDAGGAPVFANFISAELLPYTASRFRAMPFTVVAGQSLSGLFAAYLYGHSPAMINAAIAISPSLPWNLPVAYRQVLTGVRARTVPGRFFVAASRDEGVPIDSMVRILARDLGNGSGKASFEYRELAGDSHVTAPLQGAIDGLRFVFRPVSLTGVAIERIAHHRGPSAAQAVVKEYSALRTRYLEGALSLGLPERVPFEYAHYLSQWMVEEPHLIPAVSTLCEDLVRSYPALWHGQECFGRFRLATKDLATAETAFNAALGIAQQAGDSAGVLIVGRGLSEVTRARERRP